MSLCEMCGKETELVDSIIEGSMLNVCRGCAKYGIEIKKPKQEEAEKVQMKIKHLQFEEIVEMVVKDYSNKIKEIRERLNLTQKDFAFKLAEKESVVSQLESGHMEPSIHLAKKIQKAYGIKLVIAYEENKQADKINMCDDSMTIGDLIKKKE